MSSDAPGKMSGSGRVPRSRHFNRRNGRTSRVWYPYSLRIPSRWEHYEPVGEMIEGTRFVPFKTPLGAKYFNNNEELAPNHVVFQTSTMLDHATKKGKQIGLVIDLTATDRYYDWEEWREQGVEYVKIKCMGHTVHSQDQNIEQFFQTVTQFLNNNADNDKLIGVHCTHGLNRTGYLICRYLIEVQGWDSKTAVERFEASRGHKIERSHYVNSLHDDCHPGSKAHLSVPFVGKSSSLSTIASDRDGEALAESEVKTDISILTNSQNLDDDAEQTIGKEADDTVLLENAEVEGKMMGEEGEKDNVSKME